MTQRSPRGWSRPREAVWALAEELQRVHGLRRLYKEADGAVAVLSACHDVTIWYIRPLGDLLRWREDGTEATWPADDPHGAAARIATRCHDGLTRGPDRQGDGRD